MRYAIRSIKYLLLMVVVFGVAMYVTNETSKIEITYAQQLDMFMANKGALKLALLVVLAGLYPMLGFITRSVVGDVASSREKLDMAMGASGFKFVGERDGALIYKANTFFKRVAFLFEDSIEVRQVGGEIRLTGIRRGVAYAAYVLEGFLRS